MLQLARALGSIVVFVVAWGQIARFSELPDLPRILGAVKWLIDDGVYFTDIAITLLRFTVGWILGAVLAVPCGLLTGRDRRFLGPLLEMNFHVQRAVPVIALVPLTVFLWGISEVSKLFLVTWGVFFPIWVSTHNGSRSFNPNYVNAARSLGVRGLALWRRVYLPHVSESVLSGLRVAIGVGLICIVAAELTPSYDDGLLSGGLGFRIKRSAELYQIDRLLACIFTFGALGWIADFAFSHWFRRIIRYFAGFDPHRSTLRVGSSAQG